MITYNLTWLMEWYAEQWNGDWEHSYGIKIETLDNPGRSVTTDIEGTKHNQVKDRARQLVNLMAEGRQIIISVKFKYFPNEDGEAFLQRTKQVLEGAGYRFNYANLIK